MLKEFVPAETDASVMPVSSQVSMVLRAVHGNRGVLLQSTCVRIPDSPWSSRNGVPGLSGEGGSKADPARESPGMGRDQDGHRRTWPRSGVRRSPRCRGCEKGAL